MAENQPGIKTLTSKITNIESMVSTMMNNPITIEVENAIPSMLTHFESLISETKKQVSQNKQKTKQSYADTIEASIKNLMTDVKTKFSEINMINVFEVIEQVVEFVENNQTTILQYANLADSVMTTLNPSKAKLSIALDICTQLIKIDEAYLIPMINYVVSKMYPNNPSLIMPEKKKSFKASFQKKITKK
jgi:organic radical activating enzyme